MIPRWPLFFYNILGSLLLCPAAVTALASKRWREGLEERLVLVPREPPAPGRGLWVHGASVGEILAAAGLIEALQQEYSFPRVIISTFTFSGREVARKRFEHLGPRVRFTLLPLDWNGLPDRALQRWRPDVFVILETELWPNLLVSLQRAGLPLLLVNGRLSRKSFPRYERLSRLFRPLLASFTAVCVRSSTDAERFRRLGVPPERVRVAGNLKYDHPRKDGCTSRREELLRRLSLSPGQMVLVAGSLRRGEAEPVLRSFTGLREKFPEVLLVIAPRHPERFDARLLEELGLPWVRWSTVPPAGFAGEISVLLVDTLGELADFYGIASLAFVGGSLVPHGGHNLLEPAFCAIPVIFGPHFRNFEEEGKALVRAGGGFVVAGEVPLAETAAGLLADPAGRKGAGRRAREVAEEFGGALDKTMAVFREILGGRPR